MKIKHIIDENAIADDTGKIATIFCKPRYVNSRVFHTEKTGELAYSHEFIVFVTYRAT